MTPDVPVWVAVSAVDHVGNESAMSPAQSVTPRKLVDDSSIRDELGTIDDKINTAVDDLNQAIENIVIDANGTTTYWMPTAPDEMTDPKPKAGDLWFDSSAEGKNTPHVFQGGEWVSAADQRVQELTDAQEVLEGEIVELDGRLTSAGTDNTTLQYTLTDIDEPTLPALRNDLDAAEGRLDSAEGQLTDAFGQIEDAVASANGKNGVHYEDAPPTESDPGVAGDTWFVGQVGRPSDVVEATNLAPNPSFEIDTSAWEIRWAGGIEYIDRYDNAYLGVSVGDYCLGIKGTDTVASGTGLIQTSPIAVSPGEWVNVAGSFRAQESTPVAVRLRLYWLDSGGNEIGSSNLEPWRVASDLENSVPANRIVGSSPGQAPSGAVAFRLAVWYRDVNGSDAPPAGFVAYIDGVHAASASSEAGAKSAVATYFDGDTTDGATDDDPHYRWTGTPHASTSEKYLPATEGLSSNWNVTEQYRYMNGAWENVELSHNVLSSLDLGKLVAGSAAIKEAVVQKIAAQTASIQTADIKNLFVTGTASLSNVVAERIAAETAEFIELEVGNLVASGAEIDEAVINKLFADVVVARTAVADEFIGGNAILEGAVTAAHMKTGTITAGSGIIGSINAGTITVGEMDGA
ncbi:MAG: hypothetical protein L0K38_13960, partial [Yaniella sp.]|uniref:hypothetical protein n=1 Tax=Yaniella sp. TaxID=2773929 RepID=UPI0026487DC8